MVNYIGPNDGEGSRLWINGAEVANDTDRSGGSRPSGDGKIVVGRDYTNKDQKYGGVQVDEMIYFDQALNDDEVHSLYNSDL